MNTPTAREFINIKDKEGVGFKSMELEEAFVEFAKIHVEAALKQASYETNYDSLRDDIINAYPLDLIK